MTTTAQTAVDVCHTIRVAPTPCTVPEAGKPIFEIADDEIELGMGIHGEPVIWRGKFKTVDEPVC